MLLTFRNGILLFLTHLTLVSSSSLIIISITKNLPNSAVTASSYKTDYEPYKAIKPHRNREAWCPKSLVGMDSREWIQVEFEELKIVKHLNMAGLNNGNEGPFVKKFYLDYQRENVTEWRRYHDNNGETILDGNKEIWNFALRKVDFVAKRIRIIPVNQIKTEVCLILDVYGLPFSDGVVEYSMRQGNEYTDTSGKTVALIDRLYDGPDRSQSRDNVFLTGGMGQLMNGVKSKMSSIDTTQSDRTFVGWSRQSLGLTSDSVDLIFRFDRVRKIQQVRFQVLNNFQNQISVFSNAFFSFSVGGRLYGKCSPDIVVRHTPDTKLSTGRTVSFELNDSIARFVRVKLVFRLDWIVLSEVRFKTEPYDGFVVQEPQPPAISSSPQPTATDRRRPERPFVKDKSYIAMILVVLCFLVVLIIVVGLIACRLRRRHRHHRGQLKVIPPTVGDLGSGGLGGTHYSHLPSPHQQSFYAPNGTMHVPAVANSDGMGTPFCYKPVTNGGSVYDCMLPFQSQTLNLRKVSSPQLFGTFKTSNSVANGVYGQPQQQPHQQHHQRHNSSCNGNGTVSLLTAFSQDNCVSNVAGNTLLSHMSNFQYPLDNKRASIEGSYAGTGSNADYSTTSILRDSGNLDPTGGVNISASSQPLSMPPPPPPPMIPVDPTASAGVSVLYEFGLDCTWSEHVNNIVRNHACSRVPLESPVGGSLIVRESLATAAADMLSQDPAELAVSLADSEHTIMAHATALDLENLSVLACIGTGKFGRILKANYKGSCVIVKAIERSCDISIRCQLLQSVADILHIPSTNLTNILGYCEYENEQQNDVQRPHISYIITEDTKHADLYTFIRHNCVVETVPKSEYGEADPPKMALSQSCLVYIGTQIAEGMAVLEQEGLVHRDLAARNCLLGPRLSVLITDTAMAAPEFATEYLSLDEAVDSTSPGPGISGGGGGGGGYSAITTPLLPLQYMSWEAALLAQYSVSSDVWSFGVLIWQILTGCRYRPFCGHCPGAGNAASLPSVCWLLTNYTLLSRGQASAVSPDSSIPATADPTASAPVAPPSVNRELRDLLHSCWSLQPSDRPKFRDMCTFLRQKISGFNADEEYQTLRMRASNVEMHLAGPAANTTGSSSLPPMSVPSC